MISGHRGWRGHEDSPLAHGLPRLARATALATLAVTLSAAGHVAGGARLPSPVSLGVLLGLLVPGCLLVTRRRMTPLGAIGALTALQVLVHHVLASSADPALAGAGAADARLAGGMGSLGIGAHHAHGAPGPGADPAAAVAGVVELPTTTVDAATHLSLVDAFGHASLLDLRMTVAHVVAAVLVGRGVALVDRALFLLVDLLRRPLALLGAKPIRPSRLRSTVVAAAPMLHSAQLPFVSPSRGPPPCRVLVVSSADRSRLAAG